LKKLLIIVFVVLLLAPAAALAAGGTFTDDDDSVFEADIEWLAGAGVTLGCNPPTNDNFCPDDNVKRGQMAAFMRRFAAFLGAEDGVVSNADNATTATSADTAAMAEDAEMLDGLSSEAFIQHGDIVIRQSTSELTPHFFGGPSSATYATGGTIVSGDGSIVYGLTGPAIMGGVDYGLRSVEYCITEVSGGAFVTRVEIVSENPGVIFVEEETDRVADGCYTVTANHSTAQAYDMFFVFDGGGTLRMSGLQSTWAPAATLPSPTGISPTSGPDSSGTIR
jgi:hypothetical protein